jgi:hypothetical protein
MERCEVDQAVFYWQNGGKLIVIVASVDDLTILATGMDLIDHVKSKLCECFTITDIGEIHWILGIHIRKNAQRL